MAPILSLRHVPRVLLSNPSLTSLARRAAVAAGPELLRRSANQLNARSLTVNDTQKVTLGVIALYVVVIALLWNIPYVRWSLWPFKVSLPTMPLNHRSGDTS